MSPGFSVWRPDVSSGFPYRPPIVCLKGEEYTENRVHLLSKLELKSCKHIKNIFISVTFPGKATFQTLVEVN